MRHARERIRRCWHALTLDERKAFVVVASLFLLGLAARGWRMLYAAPPAPATNQPAHTDARAPRPAAHQSHR